MSRKETENLEKSKFFDTIRRTLFIMGVAVLFTRILDFPIWITILSVLLGIPVIIHAIFWIRRLDSDKREE